MLSKEYLGDGVYIEEDSVGLIILTTEDGLSITNRICIDNAVWFSLVNYVKRLNEATT